MPSALDYIIMLKKAYGDEYVRILRKHFGFLPFEIIDYKKKTFITREEFLDADHPIKITTSPEKWSCGILDNETLNLFIDEKSDKYGIKQNSLRWVDHEKHPLFNAIFDTMCCKEIVTKEMYNKVILNLHKIFYIKNNTFVLLDTKYSKYFLPLIERIEKSKKKL